MYSSKQQHWTKESVAKPMTIIFYHACTEFQMIFK